VLLGPKFGVGARKIDCGLPMGRVREIGGGSQIGLDMIDHPRASEALWLVDFIDCS